MSSSSDRTKKLSSKVRYDELAMNTRNHNTVSPIKKDGSNYKMYGITKFNKTKSNNTRNSINTFNSYS